MKHSGFGLAIAMGLALPAFCDAGSINLATGLDASNTLITTGGTSDAHWTVPSIAGVTNQAQVVEPNNADWYGGWLADGPNSAWIARNANVTNNGPAPYTFSRAFDLTGYNLSTTAITGSWAIDDSGTLNLNGTVIGALNAGAWGALTPFSVAAGSPLLLQGVNTLSITITVDDQFLEAVRLQGSVTGITVATPEPATLSAMAVGLVAVVGYRLRRKRAIR